ncbi:MAG: DUF4245 domain-containing protein [Actinomycetes bacterium]
MPTEASDEPAAAPAGRRGGGSPLDMVRSLGIVLLLIGAIALITLRPPGGDGIRVVEYGTELASARVAAPYPVLAPSGLDGYRATSVRFAATADGTVWHLGYVTPLGEYVGLDQTDGAAGGFVDDLTEGAEALGGSNGSVDLGGRAWDRYDGGGDQDGERVRGLVSQGDGATALVSGTAEWPELEAMAAALSATAG